MNSRILLFIPMFNCEKQINRVLERVLQTGDDINVFSEILIVDNQSLDNSVECAKKKASQIPIPVKICVNKQNVSLGGSHKVAFNYAVECGFDAIVVLHGDDQGDIFDIIEHIKSGEADKHESYLGSRFMKESRLINYSRFRILGNVIFNKYLSLKLSYPIKDLGAGLNYYKTSYLQKKFYISFPDTLNFNVYMLLYGIYSNSSFDFFPLSWKEEDQTSNAKFLSQAADIFRLVDMYTKSKGGVLEYKSQEIDLTKYQANIVFEK